MRKSAIAKKNPPFFVLILGFGICMAMCWGIWVQDSNSAAIPQREQGPMSLIDAVILDVPYINQRERYPTGCESVSTVMALQYVGVDITVDEFVDNYLAMGTLPATGINGEKIGCDPWEAFPGSPYSQYGYGCYAPVIVSAVNKFIDSNTFEVQELYGKPIEELCKDYIDKEIPVVFWATIDMKPAQITNSWTDEATGKRINWVAPMHCLLLVGYDDNFYYFNDPWQRKACAYRKSVVKAAYEGMFEQAIVIKPVKA